MHSREEAKGQRQTKKKSLCLNCACLAIRYEFYFKISSANLGMQNMASILTALWIELPNSSKASCVWLSLEFCGNCKRVFKEKRKNLLIFMLAVEVLQFAWREYLSAQVSLVFHHYLALAYQALSWNFLPFVLMEQISVHIPCRVSMLESSLSLLLLKKRAKFKLGEWKYFNCVVDLTILGVLLCLNSKQPS